MRYFNHQSGDAKSYDLKNSNGEKKMERNITEVLEEKLKWQEVVFQINKNHKKKKKGDERIRLS
jgi:predicted protein tyrosine phosphatase